MRLDRPVALPPEKAMPMDARALETQDENPQDIPSRPRSLRAARLRSEAKRRRKRWWIPLAIAGGLVLTLALMAWIQSLPVSWETFRSEEGDFSVDFPGVP